MLEELKAWMEAQFEHRLVEPNSSLGQAMKYLQNHWEGLTTFLRVPGAPLDNNICERALEMAILHRKSSMFYKTLRGAAAGDLLMSLIYTCRLAGENPFDYFTTLQKNAARLEASPQDWMPWTYKAAAEHSEIPSPSSEPRPPRRHTSPPR